MFDKFQKVYRRIIWQQNMQQNMQQLKDNVEQKVYVIDFFPIGTGNGDVSAYPYDLINQALLLNQFNRNGCKIFNIQLNGYQNETNGVVLIPTLNILDNLKQYMSKLQSYGSEQTFGYLLNQPYNGYQIQELEYLDNSIAKIPYSVIAKDLANYDFDSVMAMLKNEYIKQLKYELSNQQMIELYGKEISVRSYFMLLQKLYTRNNYTIEQIIKSVTKTSVINIKTDMYNKQVKFKQQDRKIAAAKNPNCPVQILQKLSNEELYDIRSAVAQNPNCSIQILKKLANDEYDTIRRAVVENPNCSIQILTKLANDTEEYVRAGVAQNPNCPIQILKKLANDESLSVGS